MELALWGLGPGTGWGLGPCKGGRAWCRGFSRVFIGEST